MKNSKNGTGYRSPSRALSQWQKHPQESAGKNPNMGMNRRAAKVNRKWEGKEGKEEEEEEEEEEVNAKEEGTWEGGGEEEGRERIEGGEEGGGEGEIINHDKEKREDEEWWRIIDSGRPHLLFRSLPLLRFPCTFFSFNFSSILSSSSSSYSTSSFSSISSSSSSIISPRSANIQAPTATIPAAFQ